MELKFIYHHVLPDLSGKLLVDVGSRLGTVLYGVKSSLWTYSAFGKYFLLLLATVLPATIQGDSLVSFIGVTIIKLKQYIEFTISKASSLLSFISLFLWHRWKNINKTEAGHPHNTLLLCQPPPPSDCFLCTVLKLYTSFDKSSYKTDKFTWPRKLHMARKKVTSHLWASSSSPKWAN